MGQYTATAARRIDFLTDTIKCSLHTATYAPNQDTHVYFSDLTNEVTGTGYTAGGVALASKTVTLDAASDETRLDAADPAWTSATISGIRYAVFYKDTTVAATSPLMGYVDLGAQSVSMGTFTVQLASNGALVIDST